MTFFRPQLQILTSVGTGIFVGLMYWRMTSRILLEIQRLSGTIARLQNEVSQLKDKLTTLESRKRKTGSGFFSLHTSLGDDDEDVYEEAYGGESDLEYQKEIEEQIIEQRLTDTTTSTIVPQATDEIFSKVDKLFDGIDSEKEQAYQLLQSNKEKYKEDAEFFWRLSKSSYQMSSIEEGRGNAQERKNFIYAAKDSAQTALSLDDSCASAHKWFAITIGSIGEFEGTQEKIKNGFIYKQHIEKATTLKPDDPSNHYLLGRWCYSVYMLSWIERKAAAALYASPPSATIEETLNHFLKADELNPGKWKGNTLFIAKCYIEMRRYKEAKKWLESGKQIPVVSQDKIFTPNLDKLLTIKRETYKARAGQEG